MKARTAIFLGLPTAAAHAGPRTSASYTVATDTADAGGRRTTSASYTNDGSAGGIAGLSTVAAPAETAKHGYIGQLYEIAGLLVSASPNSVNETATLQLKAAQLLDDATTIAVSASSIGWSVAGGPLTSINPAGLVTPGSVYQNHPRHRAGHLRRPHRLPEPDRARHQRSFGNHQRSFGSGRRGTVKSGQGFGNRGTSSQEWPRPSGNLPAFVRKSPEFATNRIS